MFEVVIFQLSGWALLVAPSFFVLAGYSMISSSGNYSHVVANWIAGHTTEFVNIGRNVVVASKVAQYKKPYKNLG